MIRTTLIATILVIATLSVARSDEEMAPFAHVTSSASGRLYFRMVPPHGEVPARGTLYRAQITGNDDPLWTVSGWYAQRVFIQDDARSLVRLGDWPRGLAPSDQHLAVAFYRDGKLLREYSTKELIQDPEAVRPSVSHYQYYDWNTPPGLVSMHVNGSYHHVFRLRTIDGITYLFDPTTGAIVNQSPSSTDIVADEKTALAIAEAVLRARFGADIERNESFKATRFRDEWHVDGNRQAGDTQSVFHVRLASRDGRVIRLERRP